MNRRSFLNAMAIGAVASVAYQIPAIASEIPIIHANGIDDDTDGLQAALSGRPFKDASGRVIEHPDGSGLLIDGGIFKVRNTLKIRRNYVIVKDSTFRFPSDHLWYFMDINYCDDISIHRCTFTVDVTPAKGREALLRRAGVA